MHEYSIVAALVDQVAASVPEPAPGSPGGNGGPQPSPRLPGGNGGPQPSPRLPGGNGGPEPSPRSRGEGRVGGRSVIIHRVHVAIGELSGVDPELLLLAFQTFRAGTLCQDADLDIHPVPARWSCPSCGRAIAAGQVLRCPDCARPARLVEGDEIVLMRIEMEVPDV